MLGTSMTDELSLEEQRAKNVKATLESKVMQGVFGGNEVKSNPYFYGQAGLSGGDATYTNALNSKEVKETREALYKAKQKEKADLGISEEAPYPTNYELVSVLMKQLQEVQAMARVGELEKYAKAVGAKMDFEVPEALKGYSQAELLPKVINGEGKFDLGKLDEEEKAAFAMHQTLVQSYERGLGLKAAGANYFADINAQGKQIADEYNKSVKKVA